MREKLDRYRFTIRLNEANPDHRQALAYLERQGPHSKAQYIANAVLYYEKAHDEHNSQDAFIGSKEALQRPVDCALIEEIVRKIMSEKSLLKEAECIEPVSTKAPKTSFAVPTQPDISIVETSNQDQLDSKALQAISDALGAFRSA